MYKWIRQVSLCTLRGKEPGCCIPVSPRDQGQAWNSVSPECVAESPGETLNATGFYWLRDVLDQQTHVPRLSTQRGDLSFMSFVAQTGKNYKSKTKMVIPMSPPYLSLEKSPVLPGY